MTISRPRRIFTHKRRFPWIAAVIVLFAAGELGYVGYRWSEASVPLCDEQAVQRQIIRLVGRATADERPHSVELAEFREITPSHSIGSANIRECAAEVKVDESETRVVYEILPNGHTNTYQVTISSL